MKEFIVIYHAPAELMKQNANSDPEEMKKGMVAWMVWAGKCGDKLVSMGAPLIGGIKLNPGGSSAASNKDVDVVLRRKYSHMRDFLLASARA